jgi:hypothetical protein
MFRKIRRLGSMDNSQTRIFGRIGKPEKRGKLSSEHIVV